jgi:uncharacterized membrane protein YgcG
MIRFSMLTRLITLALTLVLALALPALAQASGDDVIRDCAQDGDLDQDYSDKELEDAERNMPSDIDQYSDCRDVIRQAQAGGRGSTDGSGGSAGGGTGGGGSDGGGYRACVSNRRRRASRPRPRRPRARTSAVTTRDSRRRRS